MTNLNDYEFKASDSPSVDAFARWRVSSPATLFDSKQIYDNQALLWDDQEVSGSGTSSTHSAAIAQTAIAVGASTAGKRVRQTFMRFNYQSGKSQQIVMTGVLGTGAAGITQEVGLHDDDNGLFFSCIAGTLGVNIRSSTTGSAVDTTIAQSSWNLDKMDGTGDSRVTIDTTKTQIFVIDFEWLGSGRIRFGFNINGSIIYCHQFMNSNIMAQVYMSTPNLPLRYSIENDGSGAATTLAHICSTVVSEGGRQDSGSVRYKSTAGAAVTASTENVIYAVVGLKLKAANVSATVDILNVAIQLQSASETGEWTLILNPTVASTFTYSNETNSSLMTALGATANTVTNGTVLMGGFAESGTSGNGKGGTDSIVHNAIRLGSAIDGTVDTMVLCWMPNGGTAAHAIEGSITWRESL